MSMDAGIRPPQETEEVTPAEHRTGTRSVPLDDGSGLHGTLAECSCGWSSFWRVQDGSAQMEAYEHAQKGNRA